MTEILQASQNNNTSEYTDELENERLDFIASNAPDKSFFELDNERSEAAQQASINARNRALADYAKMNISFNGYTENID